MGAGVSHGPLLKTKGLAWHSVLILMFLASILGYFKAHRLQKSQGCAPGLPLNRFKTISHNKSMLSSHMPITIDYEKMHHVVV